MEALQNQLKKIGDRQAAIQALRDEVRRRSRGSTEFSKLTDDSMTRLPLQAIAQARENLTKSVQSVLWPVLRVVSLLKCLCHGSSMCIFRH